ncbi:ClpXP protease specificity-enhancing factor [Halioxenophilus sp. WMMB6]|uniref:ClpXP protease specificity-enhancing factor n=1 Tax=Halioxenophilus sp. WMMB6 TaxID=3073815 RepID=UPI00398C0D9E
MMAMSSIKPYLIKAHYQWIVDNSCTPYLMVDAYSEGVSVPQQYVNKDGQIVLNISPSAVVGLSMDLKAIAFNARFGGMPMDIYVPCYAVVGIYAKENGRGMMFEVEQPPEPEPPKPSGEVRSINSNKSKSPDAKPSLRIIK